MRAAEEQIKLGDFAPVKSFIGNVLTKKGIAKTIISETMLISEALLYNMKADGFDDDTILNISAPASLGNIRILIGFEGKRFDLKNSHDEDITPEDRIIEAYAEKIDFSYTGGYNSIRLSIKRSQKKQFLMCVVGITIAILCYLILRGSVGSQAVAEFKSTLVFPVEELFARAIITIGAPVTFLSLLKNLADTYIISERNSEVRKLQRETMRSSIIVIILAAVTCYVITHFIITVDEASVKYHLHHIFIDPESFFSELVADSIFSVFDMLSPFPMIFFAILVTYAFCSIGKYFDLIKTAVDACYVLFSRMLNIVMIPLPLFSFLAVLDLLITDGISECLYTVALILLIFVSLSVVATYYLLQLKMSGVGSRSFIRKIRELTAENLRINSAIDAVPYNIRYCAKTFGIERKKLETSLPVLAQINLDGNCFIITMISLMILFFNMPNVDLLTILTVAGMVLFLSLGAPNQPGSCLIGILIILEYMGAHDLLAFAILAEVLFGSTQNIINVIGDIVTVVSREARIRKKTCES